MSNFLYFRIEGPLSPTRQVPFEGDLVLGGGPECGLVLPHATVAARHARITGTRERLVLTSLGPPTTVRRGGSVFVVRAGIPFPLLVGDQIGVGEVRIQLMPFPEAEVPRAGGTRMVDRQKVERPERVDRGERPERVDVPAEAPAGRRPRGVTRVVDVRTAEPRAPERRPPEVRAEPLIPEPRPEPRVPEPRSEQRIPEPRPEPRIPEPRLETRAEPRPEPRRPTERPAPREVPPEPPREPPRRASVALRPQPSARPADPLEDGPTAFFSRASLRAPTEVPRSIEERPREAPSSAPRPGAVRPVEAVEPRPLAPPPLEQGAQAARDRLALEQEVAELEAAFEARGGRVREQRRRGEQRAAIEAALQAQQRPLQDAERALAAARVELAGHEHELATHERRCRELEAQLARLKARREGAEARRDESVRRLREAEQARDTTWQDVWSMEHDQLRLEGLIDNLELALGLSPKRG